MSEEMKMSVSPLTRAGEKKSVYVLFQDGKKEAEFALPGCRTVRNAGFSENELKALRDYVEGEQDRIYSMAKEVNPIKAFMK